MKRMLAFLLTLLMMLTVFAFAEGLRAEETYDNSGALTSISYYNANDVMVCIERYSGGQLSNASYYTDEGVWYRFEVYSDGAMYSYSLVEVKTDVPEGFVWADRMDTYQCTEDGDRLDTIMHRYFLTMDALGVVVYCDVDGAVTSYSLYIVGDDGRNKFSVTLDPDGTVSKYTDYDTFDTYEDPDTNNLPFEIPEFYYAVIDNNDNGNEFMTEDGLRGVKEYSTMGGVTALTGIKYYNEDGILVRDESYLFDHEDQYEDSQLLDFVICYDESGRVTSTEHHEMGSLIWYTVIDWTDDAPDGFDAVGNARRCTADGSVEMTGIMYSILSPDNEYLEAVQIGYDAEGAVVNYYVVIYNDAAEEKYTVYLDADQNVVGYEDVSVCRYISDIDPDNLPFTIPDSYQAVMNGETGEAGEAGNFLLGFLGL